VRHRNGAWQELPELRRPVSAGEINRELTVLKRMFSLAIEAGKLHHKPHFAMLREDNIRVGFFEREQYEAVLAHLYVRLSSGPAAIDARRRDNELIALRRTA
jgi:hypothetical protein